MTEPKEEMMNRIREAALQISGPEYTESTAYVETIITGLIREETAELVEALEDAETSLLALARAGLPQYGNDLLNLTNIRGYAGSRAAMVDGVLVAHRAKYAEEK